MLRSRCLLSWNTCTTLITNICRCVTNMTTFNIMRYENYAMKYESEIQSVHFGAARSQISLHTGVMYFRANKEHSDGESSKKFDVRSTSFCSVSDSLRHDPAAIWAHLMPLLELIKERHPSVDTVHFQSDGPTTQYRNKKNFCLLAQVNPVALRPGTSG